MTRTPGLKTGSPNSVLNWKKLGGSSISLGPVPANREEEFLRYVLEYEISKPTTLLRLMEDSGVSISSPETLDAATLAIKLAEIIERMASLGAYLLHTDHLSDRELYDYLYRDALRVETVLFPEDPLSAYLIDLTGGGGDEDNHAYLKYYADEEYRRWWAQKWPDEVMPDRVLPPFDRDRFLPQSPWG